MLIYGRNSCYEYLKSNKKIKKLYLDKNFRDKSIISLLENRDIKPYFYTKYELDELAEGNHQGIIMDVGDFEYSELDDILREDGFVVMLDHIEDMHNFGAIIRTCEAAGVDGIIIPKDRSVSVNSTVMKTSSGALVNTKIAMVTNLNQTIKYLQDKGYWVYSSDMNGEDYDNPSYDGGVCLVIGNEGNGMSANISNLCDENLYIKMNNEVESLNAAVATSILLYEMDDRYEFN